jgi:hypothetical protein
MTVGWFILALGAGIVVLNILGPLRGLSEKKFGIYREMLPVEITPQNQKTWLLRMMTAAILLEAVIPAVIYVLLAEELDHSGLLVGMAFWGGAWLIGALPTLVFEPMLIRVSRRFTLHNIAWSLLIYLCIGAAVGLIYPV